MQQSVSHLGAPIRIKSSIRITWNPLKNTLFTVTHVQSQMIDIGANQMETKILAFFLDKQSAYKCVISYLDTYLDSHWWSWIITGLLHNFIDLMVSGRKVHACSRKITKKWREKELTCPGSVPSYHQGSHILSPGEE